LRFLCLLGKLKATEIRDRRKLHLETFLHDLSWVLPLRNDTLTVIFNGFTFLGYLPFFLILLPMGYWLGDKAMFTRLTMLVGIVALSNSFLKDLFQDPRPDIMFAIDQRVGDSFGFPSGHAQIAVATWMWIAFELRRRWMWALAAFVAAGVCLSRLYLGVHDVEDVLGGILLGVATMVAFAGYQGGTLGSIYRHQPAAYLIGMAAMIPVLYLAWPINPVSGAVFSVSAMMIAWYAGYAWQQNRAKPETHRNVVLSVMASVFAIALLFTIFKFMGEGLAALGLEKDTVSVTQLAFMSLYATIIVPWLFRVARLTVART
jgi:glycerophosphoryl diester phosphodiesterase